MKPTQRGGALPKYLLLLLFVGLLVGYFWWKASYGSIGHVDQLPGSTRGDIALVAQDDTGQSNIYLVKADNPGDVRQLTNDRGAKRAPTWSPDGTRLCYAGEPDEGGKVEHTFQLFIVGADAPKQATWGSTAKDAPQWSPDGKEIAYLTGGAIKLVEPNGQPGPQIYPPPHVGAKTESGNTEEVTDTDATGLRRPPIVEFRWSPNSVSIAGVQEMEGENAPALGSIDWYRQGPASSTAAPDPVLSEPESVVVIPSVGGEQTFVPKDAAANKVGVAWFPDSTQLATSFSTRSRNHAIVVYHVDRKDAPPDRAIFASAGYTAAPENPVISPDGKQVAFEVWRMESAENRELLGIAVLPADVPEPLIVRTPAQVARIPIKIKGHATGPHWSPDGARLLYSVLGADGRRDVWVANADGTNQRNLTAGLKGDKFDAVWSPAR